MQILQLILMYVILGLLVFLGIYDTFEQFARDSIESDPRLKFDDRIRKIYLISFQASIVLFWPIFATCILSKFICKVTNYISERRKK
jgi:hypothetical protein